MPNYEDCVIYTIRSGDGLYVGSTCNFTKRKHNHKNVILNTNSKMDHYKLYQTIIENDSEWDMQPYKLFPCNNKMEMRIEEERCRVELNANLNTQVCYQPDKYCYQKKNNQKKMTCECGCVCNNNYLKKHQQSKKHFKLLEENQKINKNV